jgi:hypothetical protein
MGKRTLPRCSAIYLAGAIAAMLGAVSVSDPSLANSVATAVWNWAVNEAPLLSTSSPADLPLLSDSASVSWAPCWTQPCISPRFPLVADLRRNQVLAFGAESSRLGGSMPGFCTWNDGKWTFKNASTPLPELTDASLAYDSRANLVVLVGHGPSNDESLETWLFDGTAWRQARSSVPSRWGQSMAYDEAGQAVVLFGGFRGATSPMRLSDTWVWSGNEWRHAAPSSNPSPRGHCGLAFDLLRRRLVLFGGCTYGGARTLYHADTWEWAGTTWISRSPTSSPSPLTATRTGIRPYLPTGTALRGKGAA